MPRVLAILLDGYEHSVAQRLMAAGEMPELSRLAGASARFRLDHGGALTTGPGAEHAATGLAPAAAHRWNVVYFDPRSYASWQEGTRLRPFAADLSCRTVVFDAAYFDVRAAPTIRGLVNWGAHDPGVTRTSQPRDLLSEVEARFGPYPAHQWTYAFTWPSPERSARMGEELARAIDRRAEVARWLLESRLPDWDLAFLSVSETHSVIESLWHGVDPTHPLHHLPSAGPARDGIAAVYRAIDRLIGGLTAAFPEAATVVFSMGGMGVNRSDVPSMLLLPELLYRHAFGSAYFNAPPEWSSAPAPCPVPSAEVTSWERYVAVGFPPVDQPRSRPHPIYALASRALPRRVKSLLRAGFRTAPRDQVLHMPLDDWPAARYRQFWPRMPAFAPHSYNDGTIRINLAGRERRGIVAAADYGRLVAELEDLVRACIDPATGESAVDLVERPPSPDPFALESTQADLTILWKGAATCLEHPRLGRIGPVPYRRVGGHTNRFGMAYIRAPGLAPGERGLRSAFDVVPTIVQLLGQQAKRSLSGTSLFSAADFTSAAQRGAAYSQPTQ